MTFTFMSPNGLAGTSVSGVDRFDITQTLARPRLGMDIQIDALGINNWARLSSLVPGREPLLTFPNRFPPRFRKASLQLF